jgi:porin
VFGDLGGLRTEAAGRGVTLDVDHISTYQDVLDGGRDTGGEYIGTVDLELHLDFQKLGLWPGAFVRVKGEGIFGDGINRNAGLVLTPNTDSVLPLPGEDRFNASEVSFIQFLSESFGIVLGKLTTLEGDLNDFAHGNGKTQFLNQNLVFNPVTLWTVPYSALGGGVIVLPNKDSVLTVTALDSEGQSNTSGFDTIDEGGTTLAAEFRTAAELFGKPGHQTFGATWSGKERVSLDQDPRIFIPRAEIAVAKDDESWCLYYNFDHYLTGDPESGGMGLFGRLGVSDGDPNPIEYFASVGFGGKGLIPGREQDEFGVGCFYLWLSDDLPDTRVGLLDDGMGFEVFYNIEVAPWLHVTPDFQIVEPGIETFDTAYIAGVRVRSEF